MIDEYKTLTKDGVIAFYKSCEITEIFLIRKSDKAIFNFFTIAVFEERPFNKTNQQFLCKPIKINNEYTLGIQRYWMSLNEVENNFNVLIHQNKWNFNGESRSQFPKLKSLPKQYIPSKEDNRLNKLLKNNFHAGSYVLEFFDETKINSEFLLKIDELKKYNGICEKIKQYVNIDLSILRDRIGNFIFQFPINLLEVQSKALSAWDGVQLYFSWHQQIESLPECYIQVESRFDKNYMGCAIKEYNKSDRQIITIGNLDQSTQIKVWRKEPSLILSLFNGSYIRSFDFSMGIMHPEPRIFELDGIRQIVEISTKDGSRKKDKNVNYTTFITNNLYEVEKKQLEESRRFKQYNNVDTINAILDLRYLIKTFDQNGVCLWDPFLTPKDIINTLFFSVSGGVPLRAIGSINNTVKRVYNRKTITNDDVIKTYKQELDNPNNNNYQLNLEFRIQHLQNGWAFHDRFLIFPSSETVRAKVYSLGTSINSFGKSHHILQEVPHPQPIVDAFNELWEKLDKKECIVWKSL